MCQQHAAEIHMPVLQEMKSFMKTTSFQSFFKQLQRLRPDPSQSVVCVWGRRAAGFLPLPLVGLERLNDGGFLLEPPAVISEAFCRWTVRACQPVASDDVTVNSLKHIRDLLSITFPVDMFYSSHCVFAFHTGYTPVSTITLSAYNNIVLCYKH